MFNLKWQTCFFLQNKISRMAGAREKDITCQKDKVENFATECTLHTKDKLTLTFFHRSIAL